MIPLTITQPELALARRWCEEAIAEAKALAGKKDARTSTSPSAR